MSEDLEEAFERLRRRTAKREEMASRIFKLLVAMGGIGFILIIQYLIGGSN